MAKKKSFDPDALAKAGQDIVKKHQLRERVSPSPQKKEVPALAPKAPEKPIARKKKENEKTQLCRIGISFHRRVKFAAVKKDMTIRQYLEELIASNVPKE